MSNQDNRYNDLGSKIQQSVTEALASGDFSRLNGDINSTVREILNDVGDQINSAVNEARAGMVNADSASRGFTSTAYRDTAQEDIIRHQKRREELRQRQAAMQQAQKNRVKFKNVGILSGPINIFWGSICSLSFVGFLVGTLSKPAAGMVVEALFFLVGLAIGLFACYKGFESLRLHRIARQYRDLSKEKMYVSIDTLSDATGTDQKKIIKNIKKILKRGYFPEGYLDENNTTFMVSKEVYQQYLEARKNYIAAQEAEQSPEHAQSEIDSMINTGMGYTNKLRELNDQIPGEVITNKLNRLEKLLREIFDGLKEHPDQVVNCRKLMDYYLPTMIKLVEAYAEYDKVSQPGEDIKAAKHEIENTLDIINQAFVELLNKLYQNSVWDVKAEAKVLKTMLHQAGLTEENNTVDYENLDCTDFLEVEQPALEETVVNNV